MVVNKRKHPRVRARGVAANVRAQEVLKTGCVVENISAGGLLVRTDQSLEPGTPVVMDLVRPGMRKLLKLSGRVVGRVEKVPNSPSVVPGLRVQFDPMPDETLERLVQLLRDLGLSPEDPGAQWSIPEATQPQVPGPASHEPRTLPPEPRTLPPEPRTMPDAPAAPASPPDAQITAPHAIWSTPPPKPAAPPVTTPSAPFGPPFLPADMQQITWAQPEGLEETRAMSEEAVRSALEAAELTPPGGKVPPKASEAAQAALAPPPIMPVPSTTPAPPPKGEGEGASDPRLMVQIRGLLMELGDVQTKLDVKEREWEDVEAELEKLRRENRELKEKLGRTEELLRQNGIKDPYDRF